MAVAGGSVKPVGVRLVAENQAGFNQAMQKANQQVSSFGKTANTAAGSMGIGAMSLAMGVGMVAANALMSVISSVTSSIAGMASTAFNNAVALQNLTISLESLAAKEIIASGAAEDMNEALAGAEPLAQRLLKQIRDLSVASPFEYQDVVRVFQLNMAFGQTSDMSIKLTKAILDMAAASGQGSMMLERVAYNFSQMSMTGQVTMRDVRDLAMAGVDLSRVLSTELGMSIEEVNSALKAGEITMKDVSEAFVRYADKNFGGAAERMSRSFTGVMSSLKDLAFFASTDVLGPALNNISIGLGKIFDKAMAIVDSGVLKNFGIVLEVMTASLAQNADKPAGAMEQTMENLNATVQAWIIRAFEWGTQLIAQFAIGIINGVSYVINALSYIGSVIMSFLGFMSPVEKGPLKPTMQWGTNLVVEYANGIIAGIPAVVQAANMVASAIGGALGKIGGKLGKGGKGGKGGFIKSMLPKYDMGAITEYLKGFTEVDYSALNAIQSPIQSALSLLEGFGKIKAGAAGKIFGQISQVIAKMLSSNTFDQAAIDQITKQLGPYGAEIGKLIGMELQLAQATERVNKARKEETAAYTTLQKMVAEYNKKVKAGASKGELAALRAQIDVQAKIAQDATTERTAAEENLSTMDAMAEQLELQKQLVAEILEMEQQRLMAMKAAEAAALAAAAAGGAGGDGLGGIPIPVPDMTAITDAFDKLRTKLTMIWQDMLWKIQSAWIKSPLYIPFLLFKNWNDPALGDITSKVQLLFKTLFGVDLTKEQAQKVIDAFGSIGDAIASLFTPENIAGMANLAGAITGFILAITPLITGSLGVLLIDIIDGFVDSFSNLSLIMSSIPEFAKNMVTAFGTILSTAEIVVRTILGVILTIWNVFFATLYNIVYGFFMSLIGGSLIPEQLALIASTIATWIRERLLAWNTFWDAMKQKVYDILAGPEGVWTIIQSGIDTLTTTIGEFIKSVLTPLATGLQTVTEWWDKFRIAIKNLMDALLSANFARAWEILKNLMKHSTPPLAAGLDMIAESLHNLSAIEFPKLATAIQASIAPVASPSVVNTYNYNISAPVSGIVRSDQDLRTLSYYIAKEISRSVPR